MQLKLRVAIDGEIEDVLVEVAGDATVGDLAAALLDDPAPNGTRPDPPGLVVDADTADRRAVTPDTRLDRSGIRSGCTVSPSSSQLVSSAPAVVATLAVHDGPDAPATYRLSSGRTRIGRGAGSDVRLSDPLVSRTHAVLDIGDTVEIVDDGSANGIVMSGRTLERAVLHAGDRATLGATTISVLHDAERPAPTHAPGNSLAFNRSPRLDPRHVGIVLAAPEPPQPPSPHRFPVATVIAPILLAGALYAVTQNMLSILFFALSPIMVVGSWWETRSANRKLLATESARFRAALTDLATQLRYASELEQAGRRREHPSVVELVDAVAERSALVWTRRPEHDAFCEVRLGLGTRPSRNSVEMPSSNRTMPDLWRELAATVAAFDHVPGVPVVADVRRCGNVGIGGPDTVAEPVMRGLLAQFAALHSPHEVMVAAFAPAGRWDWLKWLPHTDGARLAGNAAEALALVADLELVIDDRTRDRVSDDQPPPLPTFVVLVHDSAPVARSRLVQLAERGPSVGVHVLWCSASVERLPAACRTFVGLDANTGRGTAGFVEGGHAVGDLTVEPLGEAAAVRLARQLSPLVDSGVSVDTASDLPTRVEFVDLVGHAVATTPAAVAERWRENESLPGSGRHRDRGLRALVGRTVDGPLHLDLRAEGPHALVGGTTGSGKSEFLQSWILGMAVDHSPARVTFLLVDYKGGAAFGDCVDLPHCVGLVTDLAPRLVRRALASLDAELRRREQLLHDRGAKDLTELELRDDPACPPSLVVVVDEFAALVSEVPEFVDGVVDIAQRGRSLGLHLVLATQRPAGVIKDNVRANTNLRIALRMADEGDSDDVVGTTQAAFMDPEIPGRAVVKAGPGRVTAFQAAYSGGHASEQPALPSIEVSQLRFGPGELRSGRVSTPATMPSSGRSDIERVVHTIGRAARRLALPAAPRTWLPELAPRYRLEALPTERTDDAIVFAVADDPARQQQPVVAFQPDVDGNLAVFGTGGAGKSGALRSIGLAAGFAFARRPRLGLLRRFRHGRAAVAR